MENKVFLFTDGCSLGNGKKNCRASWALYVGEDSPYNASGKISQKPSNQHAELYGIMKALEAVQNMVQESSTSTIPISFVIVTDSMYSISCITKWSRAWAKNGYKTKNGQPVKHSSVIKKSKELLENLNKNVHVTLIHTRSHQSAPQMNTEEFKIWFGNYQADLMASHVLQEHKVVEIPLMKICLD